MQYDIIPEKDLRRIQFATSIMHAYGHQRSCQLAYNPRLQDGMGLTDGEGTERTWSCLQKLISIERSSAVRFQCIELNLSHKVPNSSQSAFGC